MRSAFGKRLDVVNCISRSKPVGFLAFDAQRIFRKMNGADFTPAASIAFVCFRVTLKLVVILHVFLGVNVAVAVRC